jgi:hypothetical protein
MLHSNRHQDLAAEPSSRPSPLPGCWSARRGASSDPDADIKTAPPEERSLDRKEQRSGNRLPVTAEEAVRRGTGRRRAGLYVANVIEMISVAEDVMRVRWSPLCSNGPHRCSSALVH